MRICREEKLPVCAALMAVAVWAKTLDGKEVMIEWKKKDQYGRILGVVFTGETEVNLEMVKGGFAWHYKYFDKTPAYAEAETTVRANKRGLWSDPHPVNPHDFRKKRN